MGVALLLLVLSCLECTNKSGLLCVPLAPVAPLTHVGLVAVDSAAGPSLQTNHYQGSSEALHCSLPSSWIMLPAPPYVQSPSLFPWSAAWERRQS